MGSFTAQVSEPGGVTSSIPTHQSTAGAIGGALSGLSDLIGMGLKASTDAREKRVTGTLEADLNPIINDFKNATPSVSLVGEPADNAAAASTDTYANMHHQMDKFGQALAQDPDRRPEIYARAATVLQRAIAENPRFAEDLRQRAKEVLGFNPTAEVLGMQVDAAKAADAERRAAKESLVQTAINKGTVHLAPDGSLDYAATTLATKERQDAEWAMKVRSDDLENQIRQATLSKGTPLTDSEQAQIRQAGVAPYFENIYKTMTSSARSQLSTLMKANQGVTDPVKQDQIISGAFNKTQQGFWDTFNQETGALVAAGKITYADIDVMQQRYSKNFAEIAEGVKGGFSAAESFTRAKDILSGKDSVWAHDNNQALIYLKSTIGDPGMAVVVQQGLSAIGSVAGRTNAVQSVMASLENWGLTQHVNHIGQVAKGVKTFDDIPNINDTKVNLSIAGGTIDHQSTQTEALKDPTKAGHYNILLGQYASKGQRENDAGSLLGAAKHALSPAALSAFDMTSKASPAAAKDTGTAMVHLGMKSVIQGMQALSTQSLNVMKAGQMQKTQSGFTTAATIGYTPYYNAVSGQVEVKPNVPDDYVGSLPPIPKSMQTQIRVINQSLDATVHLKQYGPDNVKSASDDLIKFGLAQGSGISIQGAPESAEPLGKSPDKPKADPLAQAVEKIESGGNQNAYNPQSGAEGSMQVLPETQRDPGFGVTPAKDNSPEEKTRVGQDYLKAMVARYQDDVIASIAYDMGPGKTDTWLAAGGSWSKLPKETQDYIGKVSLTKAIQGRNK